MIPGRGSLMVTIIYIEFRRCRKRRIAKWPWAIWKTPLYLHRGAYHPIRHWPDRRKEAG